MIFRLLLAGCLLFGLSSAVAGNKAGKVQVGYCAQLKEIAAAKAAGFDYLELRVAEVAALTDEEFGNLLAQVKQLGIPVPAANVFIPPAIKLTGASIDQEQQMNYVRKAFDRLAKLGVQVVIFGSGGARTVPEGFAKSAAFNQLVEFGKRIAPEARLRRLTILVEPLRKQECNIINTAGEGLKLVEAINHPNFQLMVDFYHLAEEQEDPMIIIKARARIQHLHMANPKGRVFPLRWEEFDYAQFFKNLRQIGYNRRISVEAASKDFATEAPQAIAFLRRAFAAK